MEWNSCECCDGPWAPAAAAFSALRGAIPRPPAAPLFRRDRFALLSEDDPRGCAAPAALAGVNRHRRPRPSAGPFLIGDRRHRVTSTGSPPAFTSISTRSLPSPRATRVSDVSAGATHLDRSGSDVVLDGRVRARRGEFDRPGVRLEFRVRSLGPGTRAGASRSGRPGRPPAPWPVRPRRRATRHPLDRQLVQAEVGPSRAPRHRTDHVRVRAIEPVRLPRASLNAAPTSPDPEERPRRRRRAGRPTTSARMRAPARVPVRARRRTQSPPRRIAPLSEVRAPATFAPARVRARDGRPPGVRHPLQHLRPRGVRYSARQQRFYRRVSRLPRGLSPGGVDDRAGHQDAGREDRAAHAPRPPAAGASTVPRIRPLSHVVPRPVR